MGFMRTTHDIQSFVWFGFLFFHFFVIQSRRTNEQAGGQGRVGAWHGILQAGRQAGHVFGGTINTRTQTDDGGDKTRFRRGVCFVLMLHSGVGVVVLMGFVLFVTGAKWKERTEQTENEISTD